MASPVVALAAMAASDWKALLAMAPIADEDSETEKVREKKKNTIALMKKMRKISWSCQRKRKYSRTRQFYEPIKIGQRVVLRAYGRISVQSLVAVHRMFKNNSTRATRFLYTPKHEMMNTEARCAVRASFEE